jgi:hypothetical protein
MKNVLSRCIALSLLFLSLTASGQVLQPGDNLVSAGISFGSTLDDFHANQSSPGLSLHYELGYMNLGNDGVLGLGGYLGRKGYSEKGYVGPYHYTQEWNYTVIGFRAAYHYKGLPSLPQLDPYGGLMLSYNAVNYSYTATDGGSDPGGIYNSYLGLSCYVGGRWYFTRNFAAMMEVGFGVSNLTLGACYKF